jgi:hypothetical protein
LFDYDHDGDLDVFLLQGAMLGDRLTLADASMPPPDGLPPRHRLFRNDAVATGLPFRFVDSTARLATATMQYGCAAATGDVDNDGWIDLFLANLGTSQLLRNDGGGTLRDMTPASGIEQQGSAVTATFFDYDRDGRLDLFVGNNMTFDNSGATVCRGLTGAPDYCGPGAYPNEPDRLYHNRGNGTFEDVSVLSGLASAPRRPTLGAVAADLDGDGWLDLYVANDRQPNNLWLNQKNGTFRDEALLLGAAVSGYGASQASMGVDAGDFDNDLDLDLFLTHLEKETNTLYRNDGAGGFTDATETVGLAAPSLPYTSGAPPSSTTTTTVGSIC